MVGEAGDDEVEVLGGLLTAACRASASLASAQSRAWAGS